MNCCILEQGLRRKRKTCGTHDVQGRATYVLKEKLKLLKKDLKKWNLENFGNLEKQSKVLITKINFLDTCDEVIGLMQEELKRKKKGAWKIFGRYLKEMNHSYIKNQGLNGSNCRSIYDMKF